MKKLLSFLLIVVTFLSCKEEVITKPEGLIEKGKMVNIMYDLALLEAIKYQNPTSLNTNKINAPDYIYKKYKIDSLQFAQSNVYYASNYLEYKGMFDQVIKRIDSRKVIVDSLVKVENKNKIKLDSIKGITNPLSKKGDSLKKKISTVNKNNTRRDTVLTDYHILK
ncbi:DUF4296 domain-containing protein [Flavobacterium sp. WC2409]|uniref:DUF4296 domain-containing protein n=1 Tax=Flavobacterium sp. WC2409 TaxID=3234139 RepID=A0AB39W169_9FLAO